jgi:ATP-dependent DNA helicase RecQ
MFTDLQVTSDRKRFDALIDGLGRAGLISIANDTFTNPEGKEITYRKASITYEGRDPDDAMLATVWIRGDAGAGLSKGAKSKTKKKDAPVRELNADDAALETRLRRWRSELAKKSGAPAFTVFPDSAMRGIVQEKPKNMEALYRVKGLGPAKVEKFGAEILAIVRGEGGGTERVVAGRDAGLSTTAQKRASGRDDTFMGERASGRDDTSLVSLKKQSAVPKERVVVAPAVVELNAEQSVLEEKLKVWRREEAAKAGLPSFFVLSDTVLRSVVIAEPQTMGELKDVRGMGEEKVEKFGAAIVGVCRG